MFNLHFTYEWKPLVNMDHEPYEFPKPPRAFIPGNRSPYPGIYRWRISPKDPQQPSRVLIGESGDLRKRLNHYISPNNQEMKHWKMMLEDALKREAKVECQLLTFSPFTVGAACISPQGVEQSPFVRRMMENLMLVLSFEELNVIVLNKGKDSWTRRS